MKYAQLRKMDISNGKGIRVSLFTSGCTHACRGCFNTEYQSFDYGKEMDMGVVDEIIEELNKDYVSGITLLGGEPFQAKNLIDYIIPIRKEIDRLNSEAKGDDLEKSIWAYSGYTFEELISSPEKKALLELCDVLIDGKFVLEKLDLRLKFRGSSNQRILDVKKSLAEKKPVLYDI